MNKCRVSRLAQDRWQRCRHPPLQALFQTMARATTTYLRQPRLRMLVKLFFGMEGIPIVLPEKHRQEALDSWNGDINQAPQLAGAIHEVIFSVEGQSLLFPRGWPGPP
jgi:hypothetical protein